MRYLVAVNGKEVSNERFQLTDNDFDEKGEVKKETLIDAYVYFLDLGLEFSCDVDEECFEYDILYDEIHRIRGYDLTAEYYRNEGVTLRVIEEN